jgi:predicted membrane protein
VLARGPATDGIGFIRGTAVMGGFDRTSDASDFRGGDVVVIMGGCKLDLRHAAITANEAVIDVLAIMGGVEIRIPENWTVDAKVLPLMGGVTNQTRVAGASPSQRLVVRGTVFMGGVEIKN